MPNPRDAADAYADAIDRGDSDAIYDMLDDETRRALTRDDVRRLVADQRAELADQAKAVRSSEARIRANATIRYQDGEDAVLELSDNGQFRIASADALPAGAKTPAQALQQLRRVLARRSYPGFIRVMSSSTRSAMENDIRSLIDGLENPEELEVRQTGDTAVVRTPGGRSILLRREEGIWRVEDID